MHGEGASQAARLRAHEQLRRSCKRVDLGGHPYWASRLHRQAQGERVDGDGVRGRQRLGEKILGIANPGVRLPTPIATQAA